MSIMNSQFEQILRENLLKSEDKFMFFKGFGKDLQSQFPNGQWKTVNGAKVFINNGKVIAGLDNFNGLIDDFFKEKIKQEKGSGKDGKTKDKISDEDIKQTLDKINSRVEKKRSDPDFEDIKSEVAFLAIEQLVKEKYNYDIRRSVPHKKMLELASPIFKKMGIKHILYNK